MKSKILSSMMVLFLIIYPVLAQEKSRKELKEEEERQKMAQIEALINSKDFIFEARYAMPMGASQVDLSANPNYVKFNPDQMDGYMPFFGTATTGISISSENMIKFRDKPDLFKIEKKKKNFQLDSRVKGENDVYRISLSIGFDGRSTMTIVSNNRSTISYLGEVKPSWNKGK